MPFIEWVLPPAVEANRQQVLKQPKGDRAFAEILLAARDAGLERLEVACPPRVTVVVTPDMLSLREEPVANCARYGTLREAAYV